MSADREHEGLTPDEAAFVRRLAAAAEPPPMTPARRAAFDRRLEQRLARPRWRPVLLPAALAAAAVLLLFGLRGAFDRVETPRVAELPAAVADADEVDFEAALFALAADSFDEDDTTLPEDYLAIEDELLGG